MKRIILAVLVSVMTLVSLTGCYIGIGPWWDHDRGYYHEGGYYHDGGHDRGGGHEERR